MALNWRRQRPMPFADPWFSSIPKAKRAQHRDPLRHRHRKTLPIHSTEWRGFSTPRRRPHRLTDSLAEIYSLGAAGGAAGAVIGGVAPPMALVAGSLPSSPILFDGPISTGAVAPISGTAPPTVPVGGSLPSSPIVLGGAIGAGRSSANAGKTALPSKRVAAVAANRWLADVFILVLPRSTEFVSLCWPHIAEWPTGFFMHFGHAELSYRLFD